MASEENEGSTVQIDAPRNRAQEGVPDEKKDDAGGQEQQIERDRLIQQFRVGMTKEEIEKEIDIQVQKYAPKVKVPGFRKGKVPLEVVKSHFRQALLEEVLENGINKQVVQKIKKEGWRIVGQPVIEKIDHADGLDMTAAIQIETLPDIQLPDIKTLEVEVPASEWQGLVYDEQKQVEAVLEAHKRRLPVKDRAIAQNDVVVLKVQSKVVETKRMTPRQNQWFWVNPKAESDLLELYPEVIGKQIGEALRFQRIYPPDSKKKTWAGKTLEHVVEIVAVYEDKKPVLDGELLQSLGMKSEDEFRKKIRVDFDHQREHQRDEVILRSIFEKLNEVAVFPIPRTLVSHEMRGMLSQNRQPLEFKDDEERQKYIQMLGQSAERSAKLSLILDQIRKQNRIEVTDQDLEKEYRHLAEHNQLSLEEVKKYFDQEDHREQLQSRLLDAKVIEFLKENIKIKEV